MPELPEVEIVKQSLAKKIEQKKIKKVQDQIFRKPCHSFNYFVS